jgi:hypothetical protein
MKRGIVAALVGWALLAGQDAQAQTEPPSAEHPAWSLTAGVAGYLLPENPDYAQPYFFADRDRLHLEARYNYEGHKTASLWIGYNLSFGDKVTFDLTPMVGSVFGDTSGVAPGYKLALAFRSFELSSESEYVFDSGSSSDNFFYTWSELSWSPRDWVRFGLVAQRTKLYQTGFDIQRGLLVGITWKKASFTTYVFNPDADKPSVVLGLTLDF